MNDEKTIRERLENLEETIEGRDRKKGFSVPWKARVGKKRAREGWATVVTINDNKQIQFSKERIVDGTIKLSGKGEMTYHAINTEDVFFYKGKPFIFLPKKKLNPYNPLSGSHETYGQKYVLARMEGDKFSIKKTLGGSIWIIIGAAIAGYILYSSFVGG